MRFVSHIRGLRVIVQSTAVHYSNYGDRIVDRPGYTAEFSPDEVNEHDVEVAEKMFAGSFNGRTTETDEVTLTPLLGRISVFDTDEMALRERWTDEFKQMVEERMTVMADRSPDFNLITTLPVAAPWPNYLDFEGSLDQLLQKIVDDGFDLKDVLAYERQSGGRPMAIEALEAQIALQDKLVQGAEIVPA